MRRSFAIRIRIIAVLFFCAALLLLFRLYFLQILKGSELRENVEAQYVVRAGNSDERNDIFFQDKSGELFVAALMESGYLLAINPKEIKDPEKTYEKLSAIIPLDHERFMKGAEKRVDPYEEIAPRINEEQAQSVRKAGIPGVMLVSKKWRVYPRKELAAHMLGFVAYKDDERIGRYGLERYWEHALKKQADGLYVNFFAEIFSNIGTLVGGAGSEKGDIVTSIEPTVEQRLEETLSTVAEKYHSRISGGIIMDPVDGSIIALAAYPTFDPNTFNTMPDSSIFGNPMVESVFEFGSIMKPLTMAAGIDSGVITPETEYTDNGFIIRDDARVSNYDGKARGRVNMQEVLNQSLNTGAAFVAEKMGKDRFAEYMLALGFGEETGIDLPGEVPGIVSGLRSGSALDLASASFGQGIAVTPIAMARALSSLANHGAIPTPHVADSVRLSTGGAYSAWAPNERRVFQAESTDMVTLMLINAVDVALLEGKIKLERHTIAAKTGTAQIAKPDGGYYTDRYLHSFFGYFPAYEPRFLILLFTVEPQGVMYASQTLAEPFAELTRFLIGYYNIPPDR